MKNMTMSFLAIAALGIASLATETAEANPNWYGSGWYSIGTYQGYSTPGSCTGCTGGVFTAVFAVGPAFVYGPQGQRSQIAPSGMTNSENETGTVNGLPTCHAAFTQCNDQSYINAPYACSYTAGGTETSTSNLYGYYSGGTDTGYCPAAHPMQAGGVAVYQW